MIQFDKYFSGGLKPPTRNWQRLAPVSHSHNVTTWLPGFFGLPADDEEEQFILDTLEKRFEVLPILDESEASWGKGCRTIAMTIQWIPVLVSCLMIRNDCLFFFQSVLLVLC